MSSEIVVVSPTAIVADVADRPRQRRLSNSAQRRLWGTVPEETQRAYKREWRRFLRWCEEVGERPIPCDEDTLTNWVAERCDAGDGLSAIRQGVSAVVFTHELTFGEDADETPGTKECWKIIGGYKRDLSDAGWRPTPAATVTPEEFRAMVATIPADTPKGIRDRSILGTTLGAFFRRSNTMRLNLEDVDEVVGEMRDGAQDEAETSVHLFSSRSKTRKTGRTVTLTPGEHELSDPVGMLLAWVCELHVQSITSGPLYRPISRKGRILDRRLNDDYVRLLVRDTAQAAGLANPRGRTYTAHSLRASGVTMARRAGKPWSVIREHGDWAKNSTVVMDYDRPEEEVHALRGVGL